MVVGWLKYKNQWYYLRTKIDGTGIEQGGQMIVGWKELDGKWYYFKSSIDSDKIERGGQMVTGWKQIGSKWYYFKPEESAGYMVTGWRQIEHKGKMQWFYFKDDGAMAQSEPVIDAKTGQTYWADENGVCTAASEEPKEENSPLVVYTQISPNSTNPRNHAIDTITIHCMAGNLSVETCGNVFAPSSAGASSNYGIGTDGRIAMYVEEKNRLWCSFSASNEHRAVTIEVANNVGDPIGQFQTKPTLP